MLINKCSRQCVLKLKAYSDKKASASARTRSMINSHHNDDNNPNSTLIAPLVSNPNNVMSSDSSTDIHTDQSFLGRLLNCKPCKKVTDDQNEKNVRFITDQFLLFETFFFRNYSNEIGKIVKRIYIGNTKQKNTTLKHKKRIKLKRN